jgi:hypothetical protein
MSEEFTGAREGRGQACDGHYSATVGTAYNTVGSRFDKVTCAEGTPGGRATLSVVEVILVTGVKWLGQTARGVLTSNEQGPRPGDVTGRVPERGLEKMKRIYVALTSLLLLILAPALVSAEAAAAPVSRDQAVNYVITRGLAQRGVPYSWGGGTIDGPSLGNGPGATTVGFDSSGLMQYVFAGVGAKIPRSSGAMYNVGQKVTADQALPADLIFYGPDGTTTVTLFLGNNQMLEVTDAGVVVSPVRTTDMAPYLIRIIA